MEDNKTKYDNSGLDTSGLLYRFRGSLHGYATITKEENEYISNVLKKLDNDKNLIDYLNDYGK